MLSTLSLASPHFGNPRCYWLLRTTKISINGCHSPSCHINQVMVPSPKLPSPTVPSPIKHAAQSFTAILHCAQSWKRQKAAQDQEISNSLSTAAAITQTAQWYHRRSGQKPTMYKQSGTTSSALAAANGKTAKVLSATVCNANLATTQR